MNQDNSNNVEAQKSSGVILKEKRKALGLTLEIAHETTKVPMDVLRAIEEGYTVRTLTPFYYRGFLKIYANYLDVQLKDFEVIEKKKDVPKYSNFKEESFDWQGFSSKILTRKRKQYLVIAIAGLFFFFVFSKILSLIFHKKESAGMDQRIVRLEHKKKDKNVESKDKKKIKKEVSVVKSSSLSDRHSEEKIKVSESKLKAEQKEKSEESKQEKAAVPASVVESSVNDKSKGTSSKEITLTVRAKKTSWLRVLVDGQVVFQSTLTSGTVEKWDAKEKIEISGRNISQLEFELNGKLIGPLGREDRLAKRVVVTKNGLSVTK